MNHMTRPGMLAIALLCAALTVPHIAVAQDLQYSSTTKLEIAGTAGRAVNLMSRLTGKSNESTETVFLKGNYMRTDDDESSTILDLAENRFVILNHDQKTYAVMNFADMAGMAEEMAERAEEALEEARAEAAASANEEARGELEDGNVKVEYDLKVERTGESRTIRGHRAERYLMIMTAKGQEMAQDESQQEAQGAFVIANEIWLTKDPAGDLEPLFAFQEQMAGNMIESFADMGSSAQSMGDGLQAAFASDPRMGEMMKNAAEEMAKMDGFPLISVMKLVAVPGEMEFDASSAFAAQVEEKEEVSATQRAGRLARSFARNRFGRGSRDDATDDEQEEAQLTQSTLMTITTEISDVQRTALPDDLFAIPADYAERSLTTLHE